MSRNSYMSSTISSVIIYINTCIKTVKAIAMLLFSMFKSNPVLMGTARPILYAYLIYKHSNGPYFSSNGCYSHLNISYMKHVATFHHSTVKIIHITRYLVRLL
jgi:hypothetical protein